MKKYIALLAVLLVSITISIVSTRYYMITTAQPSSPCSITWGENVYTYE